MSHILSEYADLMSDPAHVLAELTFLMIDILIVTLAAPFIWRKLKTAFHKELDKSHGYNHSHQLDKIALETIKPTGQIYGTKQQEESWTKAGFVISGEGTKVKDVSVYNYEEEDVFISHDKLLVTNDFEECKTHGRHTINTCTTCYTVRKPNERYWHDLSERGCGYSWLWVCKACGADNKFTARDVNEALPEDLRDVMSNGKSFLEVEKATSANSSGVENL